MKPVNTPRRAAIERLTNLLQECEDEASTPKTTVQHPPQAVTRAIRASFTNLCVPEDHEEAMYRLILCGQWPWYWGQGDTGQQSSREQASVYSFPYIRFHKGTQTRSPPRSWKDLQRRAAEFAGDAWRAIVAALLRDRHPDRLHVHSHARHLWWSVFGRDTPLPGHRDADPSVVTKHPRPPKPARIRRFFPARAGQVPSHEGKVQQTLRSMLRRNVDAQHDSP